MKPHWACALVLLSGCLPALPAFPSQGTAPHPPFDPIAFFEGRTEGLGTLVIRGRRPEGIRVQSVGTPSHDGFLLRQRIQRGDAPPFTRTWTLVPDGHGRWTGSLTEAVGPVRAVATGDRLRITYRTGRVTTVEQVLRLEPGRESALNLLTVRMLGIPIARLVEQIRRSPRSTGGSSRR